MLIMQSSTDATENPAEKPLFGEKKWKILPLESFESGKAKPEFYLGFDLAHLRRG